MTPPSVGTLVVVSCSRWEQEGWYLGAHRDDVDAGGDRRIVHGVLPFTEQGTENAWQGYAWRHLSEARRAAVAAVLGARIHPDADFWKFAREDYMRGVPPSDGET